MGERVVLGSLAVTVNKVETQAGPEGYEAEEGSTWLFVYVTVENVSNEDVGMYADAFTFVDQSGVVYDSLVNRPSSWDEVADDILEYTTMAPGGKLTDKLLLIKMKESVLPGLRLRHEKDDGNLVLWDLGL